MRATWAVVLVHGVGDTQPGATTAAFLKHFLAGRPALEENAAPQERLLAEPEARPPRAEDIQAPPPSAETNGASHFPMHLRTFSNATPGEPGQVALAEVFWADLSRAGDSWPAVLRRTIGMVFDLRHLADVAAAERNGLARVLRVLLYLVSWLLCGPIAGVTAFVIALLFTRSVAARAYENFMDASRVPAALGEWAVAAFGVAMIGAMVPLHRWRKRSAGASDGAWTLFTVWVALCAALSILISACRQLGPVADFPWNLALGRLLAERMRVNPSELVDAASTHVAVLLGFGYSMFALLAVVAFLAAAVWVLARLNAWRSGRPEAGPALDCALGASMLQVMLWVLIGTALGVAVLELLDEYQTLRGPVLAGLAFKLGVCVVVGLCAFGVLVVRSRLRHTRDEIPRLLIHRLVMAALLLATLGSAGLFAWMFLIGSSRLHDGLDPVWAKWFSMGFGAAIAVPFVAQGVRNLLHILLDVTTHFFRPSLNPFASELKTAEFLVQQRIEARCRRVLQEVLALENVTHLTVIAHSQGTVIALDVLWHQWARNLLQKKEVALVTMGSPFTHLYQYYFPQRYPALFRDGGMNPAWGDDLPKTVQRWINLYRVDDYIGTRVNGGNDFPVNQRIANVGGHTGYWGDAKAMAAMAPYLPAGFPATAKAA